MSAAGVQLLNAATVTGVGSTWDSGQALSGHGFWVVTTGSPASYTVALEGSIDGVNWTSLVGSSGGYAITSGKPVRYLRANLTAFTGGTSPTFSAYYAGS